MKKTTLVSLLASMFASMYALPSQALVIRMQACQTSDQQYEVTITNNEGIGLTRSAHYSASITNNAGEEVGSYSIESDNSIKSASFGRDRWIDQGTSGQNFTLAYPSTNYRHISLNAVLNNGQVLSDDNMNCSSN